MLKNFFERFVGTSPSTMVHQGATVTSPSPVINNEFNSSGRGSRRSLTDIYGNDEPAAYGIGCTITDDTATGLGLLPEERVALTNLLRTQKSPRVSELTFPPATTPSYIVNLSNATLFNGNETSFQDMFFAAMKIKGSITSYSALSKEYVVKIRYVGASGFTAYVRTLSIVPTLISAGEWEATIFNCLPDMYISQVSANTLAPANDQFTTSFIYSRTASSNTDEKGFRVVVTLSTIHPGGIPANELRIIPIYVGFNNIQDVNSLHVSN